jgi:hypothetical protein
MNSIAPGSFTYNSLNLTKSLVLSIFISVGCLSVKAVYDIANFNIFPVWFVPGFSLAVLGLNALGLYFVFQVWKITDNRSHLLSGKRSAVLWLLIPLSFICTTSVHGFYPFRSTGWDAFLWFGPVMKINYAIAFLGVVISTALAGLYIGSRTKTAAVTGLLVMALLTLIPNDNCYNPFNYWWIEKIGASPLMYAPNLYATLFVASGLHGIRPKSTVILTLGICVGSLILGLGHQLGIIW